MAGDGLSAGRRAAAFGIDAGRGSTAGDFPSDSSAGQRAAFGLRWQWEVYVRKIDVAELAAEATESSANPLGQRAEQTFSEPATHG